MTDLPRDKMGSFVWLMGVVCFVICGIGWGWFDRFVWFVLERYTGEGDGVGDTVSASFAISGDVFVLCLYSVFCVLRSVFLVLYP